MGRCKCGAPTAFYHTQCVECKRKEYEKRSVTFTVAGRGYTTENILVGKFEDPLTVKLRNGK